MTSGKSVSYFHSFFPPPAFVRGSGFSKGQNEGMTSYNLEVEGGSLGEGISHSHFVLLKRELPLLQYSINALVFTVSYIGTSLYTYTVFI